MGWPKIRLPKKIAGISLGGLLGSASPWGLAGSALGSKASGVNPLDDLRAGTRNAAVLFPAAAALNRTGMPGTPGTPGGEGGDIGTESTEGGGGAMDWLKKLFGGISGGDILKAGGSAVGGYMDARQQAAAIAEAKRQYDLQLAQRQAEAAQTQTNFDRTTGNTEGQLAVQAQTRLNSAPLADQAQAMLRARMGAAPTTFQPRDFTKGTQNLAGAPTGGPQDQTAAMQTAAANYTPGSGGVDTSALRMLLQRLSGGAAGAPGAPAPDRPRPTAPARPLSFRPTRPVLY